MRLQSSNCQRWYFVWVFGYENEELIMPKLVLCLGFWIRRCRAHPAKVGTLSGFLDMRMQRASCQSWYFVRVFGYKDSELTHPAKVCLCMGFLTLGCRAHPAKVHTLSVFF